MKIVDFTSSLQFELYENQKLWSILRWPQTSIVEKSFGYFDDTLLKVFSKYPAFCDYFSRVFAFHSLCSRKWNEIKLWSLRRIQYNIQVCNIYNFRGSGISFVCLSSVHEVAVIWEEKRICPILLGVIGFLARKSGIFKGVKC